MSHRCSICRHPQRDSINVSLSRDGTRSTARQFEISLPSLDRHKRHLHETTVTADEVPQVTTGSGSSMLSRIETLMGQCESALNQAQASKNLPGILRASKELRACVELKHKLETAERKESGRNRAGQEPKQRMSDDEFYLGVLQDLYRNTKEFHPLKIWQLKSMYETVAKLVQAKLDPEEIAQRMRLVGVGGLLGPDLTFGERIFGILDDEEWKGREEEVARSIVHNVRKRLKGFPGILQHLDAALMKSAGELGGPSTARL
jgi:hypothetical protein